MITIIDTVSGGGMPFVASGNSGDGGFGGGGAIWAIVLIALLGFNRGGRADDCGGNNIRDGIDNAELNARFNSLENQISNVNDMAELRATYQEACSTNMNVSTTGAQTQREVLEAKFDNALIAKDAQLAAQSCCCETQRTIDQLGFNLQSQISECCCTTNLNNERNTNALMGAIRAEGEATRNQLTADKIEGLRDELQAERLKASQWAQNEYLTKALGQPTPVPAYITYPNCSPVFPPQIAASSGAVYGAFAGNGQGYGYCGC